MLRSVVSNDWNLGIAVCQDAYGDVCFEGAAKPFRAAVMGAELTASTVLLRHPNASTSSSRSHH
jgi:hypothetical protein